MSRLHGLLNLRKQFRMLNASSSNSCSRTLSKRYVFRALLAMLVAVATIVTMLIVPPVQEAKGYADGKAPIHAWWNSFGTGFVSGSGFGIGDAPSQIASNVEVVRNVYDSSTGRNRTQIKWEVFFNTYSQMYESIVTGEPYSGKQEDKAFGGKRPLLMAWLPKGIDRKSIRISRRKSGNRAGYRNYGCWPETDKWYSAFPKDKQFDKTDNGRGCRAIQYQEPVVTINKTLDEFVNSSSRWAHSFDGNLYEGKAGKEGVGKDQQLFNSYWDNALGTSRLTSYCDSNDKHDMCEIRNWKNDFSTVLADWEVSGNTAFQWNITAFVDESMENRSDLVLKNLPFSAGWNSGKGTYSESDFGDLETKKNGAVEVRSKWTFIGPFDSDGDGIPDSMEGYDHKNPDALPDFSNSDQPHTVLNNITDPNGKTEIKYPQYSSSMMNDYVKKLNNQNLSSDTTYGGVENVPVTTYGTPVTIKPYVNTGSWQGWDLGDWDGQYSLQSHYGGRYVAGKDTDTTTNIPSDFPNGSSMKYELTSIPQGVTQSSSCSTGQNNSDKGCVSIDSKTGYITYNPGKLDRNSEGITFKVKITHPTPSAYQYNCKYTTPMVQENVPIKIKVVSNAMLYNPQYKETTVAYDPNHKKFNPTDSEEPKSVRANKKPWVRVGNLPKGSTFKLEKYGKYGSPVLDWSKIDSKNTGNGKVTFSPSKTQAGKSEKTPVLVTYPDGSTSKDSDAGNYDKVVYAPVKVGDLPISGGDLNLGLYDGNSINNNGFWGFSFRDKTNPHEIDKGKKIGLSDKDHKNPNKGIVFDSWAKNGKGPITFRVICHRTDVPNSPFALLKPKEGNKEASGEINGLHFEDFRQWIRDNDKRCKGKDCSNDNLYLHSREYENDTMERSRAMIGGTPKEGGSYECKVFAFHEKYDDKNDHGGLLKAFDDTAKNGGPTEYSILFNNYESIKATTKGSEWITDSFYFKIKLKDNQKYNPTYTKMPTILAGSTFDKNLKNHKADISSDTPRSKKIVKDSNNHDVNANGVPKEDLVNVKEGALPAGTWYEIKRFVKAGDIKNSKAKSLPWANFEDGEDNKADGKSEAASKDATGKGSVTFRPDKWQDDGEYWAEIRVHYPDGSVSDGDDSINKDHPIYAKVKVTRPDISAGDLHVDVYKYFDHTAYNSDTNKGRVDSADNIANVDNKVGVTVMRGIGLLNDLGVDSWSTNKRGGITLRTLCRDANEPAKGSGNKSQVWSENLNKLFFKLNGGDSQKVWGHANFRQQETCRKNGNKGDGCVTDVANPMLFDSTRGTMERSRGFISNTKAPTETGKYYCAVFALKPDALTEYKNAVKKGTISVVNNSDIVSAMSFKGESGIDYAAKFFPVYVVKPFKLPKTGGVNWNMFLGGVVFVGTSLMFIALLLDQSKWGRALIAEIIKIIKVFIRKTARKWRIERWRC